MSTLYLLEQGSKLCKESKRLIVEKICETCKKKVKVYRDGKLTEDVEVYII